MTSNKINPCTNYAAHNDWFPYLYRTVAKVRAMPEVAYVERNQVQQPLASSH